LKRAAGSLWLVVGLSLALPAPAPAWANAPRAIAKFTAAAIACRAR